MIHRSLGLVVGLSVIVSSADSSRTFSHDTPHAPVIDFERFLDATPVPVGAEITDQYRDLGVVFSSKDCPDDATQATTVLGHVPTPSPRNSLAPCGPQPGIGGTLVMTFDPPVTHVTATLIDDDVPVVWRAFGPDGDLVDRQESDGDPLPAEEVSVSSRTGIQRVEATGGFRRDESPDGWVIDDLSFEQLDGSQCPLELALEQYERLLSLAVDGVVHRSGTEAALRVVRGFRDKVLLRSRSGRELVRLYYTNGDEVKRLMQSHPQLAAASLELVFEALPHMSAASTADGLVLDAETVSRGMGLLDRFEPYASMRLKRAIDHVRSQAPHMITIAAPANDGRNHHAFPSLDRTDSPSEHQRVADAGVQVVAH